VRQRTERTRRLQHHHRMNLDRIEGRWKKLRGAALVQWGELLHDPQCVAEGRREQRAGRVQELRGVKSEAARLQLEDFMRRNRHWENPSR